MGIGIRKNLNRLYIDFISFSFSLRKFLFGFENANRLLRYIDKRAVIPILRRYGARIGYNSDLETPLYLHNCMDYSNLVVGNNCHIGKDVFLDLRDQIVIGDSVTISMRTTIITHLDVGKSPLEDHGFTPTQDQVVLGRGCYIGANALILQGVSIGECSVVSAGAVVIRDVYPFTVVAGIPAKAIKKINI